MRRLVAVTFLILGFTVVASAQFDSGQISGFVRDSSQAIITGASLIATNEGNGEQHRTATNSDGYYVFPNLVVGKYTITAEAAGFKKFIQKGVELSAAAKIGVDIEMQVGAISESVQVVPSAGHIQSETAQVGSTVDSRQIQNLTLNGRNPIFLALLKPGVISGNPIGTFAPDSVSNGDFSINGGRSDEYVVMVDGAVATRTRSSGSILGAQNVDTIQEVQILTANYSAEYGRSSAGQIRFVTKSGTRHFHGDLVENFRNSWLDANSWTRNHSPIHSIASRAAPFRFNQYGYDIGGPIFIPGKFNSNRSKLFFFAAQEWITRREEQTSTATVPSLAMRRGDFSELLNRSNTFFGRVRIITNPATGKPFPNNIVTTISPNGQALLNAYPLPTPGFQQGSDNWIGTEHRWSDLRKDTFKIDYLATEKERISFR